MEYGLIVFKDTENIGDDIQSYAAMQFLPKVDYYIEREKMDLFVPQKEKQVITIMNGWFMHSKISFCISPYIYPIYVSTHLSSYNSGGITTEYLNDFSKNNMVKYGPVGCRDHGTMKLLDKIGVKNYFSGCVTLTLKKDKNIRKNDNICIVDIDERAEKKVYELFEKDKIIKKTHVLDKDSNSKLSWEERFKNVKELLDTYQESKLVITSRLHCVLPCLALGTPVLLLYDEKKDYTKDRLSDYVEIVNHISTEEFLKSSSDEILLIKENPKEFKNIRKNIENKVLNLLDKINFEEKLPSIKIYEELYIKPKKNIDYLYILAIKDLSVRKNDYINLGYERDYWKKEYEHAVSLKEKAEKEKIIVEQKNIELTNEIERLKKITGYAFFEKIRNKRK